MMLVCTHIVHIHSVFIHSLLSHSHSLLSLDFIKLEMEGRSVIRVSSVGLQATRKWRVQKGIAGFNPHKKAPNATPNPQACHCNIFDHDKRQRPKPNSNRLVSLPPPKGSKTCAISADGSGDFPQKPRGASECSAETEQP